MVIREKTGLRNMFMTRTCTIFIGAEVPEPEKLTEALPYLLHQPSNT